MLGMEYHTQLSIVKEEDEPFGSSRRLQQVHGGDHRKSVFEQYRERNVDSDRFQRQASSNHAVQQLVLHPAALTRSLSDTPSGNGPSSSSAVDWNDVDLIDFDSDVAPELPVQQQVDVDADVIRELVKPFAISVDVIDGRLQRELHLMDNDVYNVRFSDPQAPVTKDVDVVVTETMGTGGNMASMSDPANLRDSAAPSSVPSSVSSGRSEEYQSASEDADAESSGGSWMKDEEKGSPATRAYNKAFNTIMRRKTKAAVHNSVRTSTLYLYLSLVGTMEFQNLRNRRRCVRG